MKNIVLLLACLLASYSLYSNNAEHLIYSSIQGGNGDDKVIDAVTSGDTLYLLIQTTSSGLYTSPGAISEDLNFLADIYIKKYHVVFDELNLLNATYWGTEDDDIPTDLDVAPDGSIVVSGYTSAAVFESKNGIPNLQIQGQYGFILRINNTLSEVLYATRFGGSGQDLITAVHVDRENVISFCGQTGSDNLPTTNLADQSNYGGGVSDGFYGRLNKSGTSLVNLSYLGGTGEDYVQDIYTENDFIYVLGSTTSSGLKTHPSGGIGQWRSDPYMENRSGKKDLLIGKYIDGNTPEFLTYFGGTDDEIPGKIHVINDQTFFSGTTYSGADENFDYSNNAANSDLVGGESDMFMAMLKPLETIRQGWLVRSYQELGFATAVGSRGNDIAQTMVFDESRFAFVLGGQTDSKSYPVTTGNRGFGEKDGVVSIVTTTGSKVETEFVVGGRGNDEVSAVTSINGSVMIATMTSDASSVNTTWNSKNNFEGQGQDIILSRFSEEEVSISTPNSGSETCRSGFLNISFSRSVQNASLLPRVYLVSTTDPEDVMIFDNDLIESDFLSISFEEYAFNSNEYIVRVVLSNGVYDYLEPGIILLESPEITDFQLTGIDELGDICEGNPLTFTVSDNGVAENYRWFHNNKLIQGQNTNTLTFSEILPENEGSYRVEVIGFCGPKAESDRMEISVIEKPVSIAEIENIEVNEGDNIDINLGIEGGEDLEYQWFKNDELILGESTSRLRYTAATTSQNGRYKAIVMNDCSEIESNEFTISVITSSVRNQMEGEYAYISGDNRITLFTNEVINSSEIALFDTNGKIVATANKIDNNRFVFENVNNSGVFFVVIGNVNPRTYPINYLND